MENGLKPSIGGRMGSGVYVSDSPEGTIAEFTAHNPDIDPTVLEVQYDAGQSGDLRGLQDSGATIPTYKDGNWFSTYSKQANLVYYSQRLPGAVNTVIRNGTARAIRALYGIPFD